MHTYNGTRCLMGLDFTFFSSDIVCEWEDMLKGSRSPGVYRKDHVDRTKTGCLQKTTMEWKSGNEREHGSHWLRGSVWPVHKEPSAVAQGSQALGPAKQRSRPAGLVNNGP